MRKMIFMGLFLASILVLGSFAGEARAASIHMLPPEGCPTDGNKGVIVWDTQSPLGCVSGFNVDQLGNVSMGGSAQVANNTAECTEAIAGAIRYDAAKKYPEYCDGTEWKAFGNRNCPQTKAIDVFKNPYGTIVSESGAASQHLIANSIIPEAPNGQIIPYPGDPTKGGGIIYFQCVNGTFRYFDNDLGCRVFKNGSWSNYKNGQSWYIEAKITNDMIGDPSNCSCVKGNVVGDAGCPQAAY